MHSQGNSERIRMIRVHRKESCAVRYVCRSNKQKSEAPHVYMCSACLYDIKAVFIIVLNVTSFKIHSLLNLQHFPSLEQPQMCKSCPSSGREEAMSCHVQCSSSKRPSARPIQRCDAQNLSSDVSYSMLLYSLCVPI
jgi:hypothetical protein